jgi:hypothetical protein
MKLIPAPSAARTVVIETGIRTVNALNVREHPQARARRARAERGDAQMWVLAHRDKLPALPVLVTLTRRGVQLMDAHDGLRASLKHVVDGVADAFRIKDNDSRIAWAFTQEKVKRQSECGVRITIAAGGAKGRRP